MDGGTPNLVELSRDLEEALGVPPLVRVASRGKAPIDQGWPEGPRVDPEQWRTRLASHSGNVGAVLGAGLVVIDLDDYKPEGALAHQLLEDADLLPAVTVRAQTGGGGEHVWLHFDPEVWEVGCGDFATVTFDNGSRLPGGAEWKATGGQVVIPPSVHPSGNPYVWLEGLGPHEVPVAEAPEALLVLIGTRRTGTGGTGRRGPWQAFDPDQIDPKTAEAVAILVEHFGATDPILAHAGQITYARVTRPGKQGEPGGSATVGYVAPGVVKLFTSSWPDLGPAGSTIDLPTLHALLVRRGTGRPISPFVEIEQIRSEIVTWLWEDRIPAGQLTLAVGQEKIGKSTALVGLAAMMTRGELPGDFAGKPLDVLFVSGEDSPEHVLKPRFVAAGGNLTCLRILDPRGTGFNVEAVRELHPDVLVVDPISSFVLLPGSNEHGEVMVRQALAPFVELTLTDRITVIGIRHVRKSAPGDNPFDAVLGSRAWSAAARALLFFTPDPEAPDEPRGLIFSRGNLARSAPALRYRLDSAPVDLDDGNTADFPLFVMEEGGVDLSLDDALGPREQATAHREAEQFLRAALKDGAIVPAADLLRAAQEEGISEKALRRAEKRLGVVHERQGFGPGSVVTWRLPA